MRRHARVRHRPRSQRGDRVTARIHASRRCLGLGQVLRRRHRRPADPWRTMGRSRSSTGPAWASSRSRNAFEPAPFARSRSDCKHHRMSLQQDATGNRPVFIQHEIVDLLAELVRLESPSRDKPALDVLGNASGGPASSPGRLRSRSSPIAQGGDHVLGPISAQGRPAAGPRARPLRHGLAAGNPGPHAVSGR